MNYDSLNMVSRLGEGHMPCTFFLSEPQLKTTVKTTMHKSPGAGGNTIRIVEIWDAILGLHLGSYSTYRSYTLESGIDVG